jgi:hypothetical protein
MDVKLRKSTLLDLQNLAVNLAVDPYHGEGTFKPWLDSPGERITFYDDKGILFHILLERTVRIHFQHNEEADKRRLIVGIKHGIEWLKTTSAAAKPRIVELLFDSIAEPLIKLFARWGFKPSPHEQKVRLHEDHD